MALKLWVNCQLFCLNLLIKKKRKKKFALHNFILKNSWLYNFGVVCCSLPFLYSFWMHVKCDGFGWPAELLAAVPLPFTFCQPTQADIIETVYVVEQNDFARPRWEIWG